VSSRIPDLVYALTKSLEATAQALGSQYEGMYYDNDHEFGDFCDEFASLTTTLDQTVAKLLTLSGKLDEQASIQRARVDPKLIRARRALRDIARGKVDDAARAAEEGLAATFRE
jgi:soluble cytochrome b562